MTKVALIGAGNLATHLGKAIKKAGYEITQVYSRTQKPAQALAEKLGCEYAYGKEEITGGADIYLLAVRDDQIGKLAERLSLNNQIIIHTSGSVPASILKNASENYGVLYPLQSFSKDKAVDLKAVPFFIEASNEPTKKNIAALAQSISGIVHEADDEQRLTLHISAVMVNNFANHLYFLAENLLREKQLSFDLLKPLIKETTEKLDHLSPAEAQTGPAVRNDSNTISKHLHYLEKHQEITEIYKLFTESITKTRQHEQ